MRQLSIQTPKHETHTTPSPPPLDRVKQVYIRWKKRAVGASADSLALRPHPTYKLRYMPDPQARPEWLAQGGGANRDDEHHPDASPMHDE